MYEPFSVISDVALDRGLYALELEYERTTAEAVLSASRVPEGNLPRARANVAGGNHPTSNLPFFHKTAGRERRHPKVHHAR